MTSFQYYVAASIDGFIADRDNRLDWLLRFGFEAFDAHYRDFFANVGALVMGARTYEFLLDEGMAWPYGSLPTWVLTHGSPRRIPDADLRVEQVDEDGLPDLRDRAARAAGGRNVWVVGGGDVAARFADAGLLDELMVTTMPIVLGGGRPVLPVREATPPLRLLSRTPFDGGAVEHVYAMRP